MRLQRQPYLWEMAVKAAASVMAANIMRQGSMVKRLRHRPFTAVTRVRFPLESFALYKQFFCIYRIIQEVKVMLMVT